MTTGRQQGALIDRMSACATQITLAFNEKTLSTATCFFWKSGIATYLVTNWHNLSGKNALTGKHLDKIHASEPDRLSFFGYRDLNFQEIVEATVLLHDKYGRPEWLEHPLHGKNVDVVCLKLAPPVARCVFPINQFIKKKLSTSITDEVFVLGYPLGISLSRTPIWKRATIASEPGLDADNLPKFFIDTASAKGMSGAPIVRRTNFDSIGWSQIQVSAEILYDVVGVYSGRVIHNGSLDAQLGIGWKTATIEEIIAGAIRGGTE